MKNECTWLRQKEKIFLVDASMHVLHDIYMIYVQKGQKRKKKRKGRELMYIWTGKG